MCIASPNRRRQTPKRGMPSTLPRSAPKPSWSSTSNSQAERRSRSSLVSDCVSSSGGTTGSRGMCANDLGRSVATKLAASRRNSRYSSAIQARYEAPRCVPNQSPSSRTSRRFGVSFTKTSTTCASPAAAMSSNRATAQRGNTSPSIITPSRSGSFKRSSPWYPAMALCQHGNGVYGA